MPLFLLCFLRYTQLLDLSLLMHARRPWAVWQRKRDALGNSDVHGESEHYVKFPNWSDQFSCICCFRSLMHAFFPFSTGWRNRLQTSPSHTTNFKLQPFHLGPSNNDSHVWKQGSKAFHGVWIAPWKGTWVYAVPQSYALEGPSFYTNIVSLKRYSTTAGINIDTK